MFQHLPQKRGKELSFAYVILAKANLSGLGFLLLGGEARRECRPSPAK